MARQQERASVAIKPNVTYYLRMYQKQFEQQPQGKSRTTHAQMRAHTLADEFPLTVTGRYCLDFNAHSSEKYKNTVWGGGKKKYMYVPNQSLRKKIRPVSRLQLGQHR